MARKQRGGGRDWALKIPFTDTRALFLKVHSTLNDTTLGTSPLTDGLLEILSV
jgi:hypothetical protein